MMPKPRSARRFTGKIIPRLSRFATETKTLPAVGSEPYAAACDLANARPNPASMPITSPVDFISGPSSESSPLPAGVRNRLNGSTASFTEIGAVAGSEPPSPTDGSRPSSRSDAMLAPSMIRAAALASGTAVALETNGTVREARGFASSTYSMSSLRAYWTLSNPHTPTPCAIASVYARTLAMSAEASVIGGSAHAESPEWIPASSMCSMIPPR